MNQFLIEAFVKKIKSEKMKDTERPVSNFNTTTFELLNFHPHPSGMGGVQAFVEFDNGFSAS